jgi:hypothetical protein
LKIKSSITEKGSASGLAEVRRRGLAFLFLFIALLLGLPGEAIADNEAGSGAGTGSETVFDTNPDDPPPPIPPPPLGPPVCLEVEASEYEVTATGPITSNDKAVIYSGDDIEITYTTVHPDGDNYFVAPEGTYGARNADGTCDVNTLGPLDPIPVTVEVNAAGDANSGVGTGAGGTCSGEGAYYRVNTTVTVTWSADCDVDGNVPGSDGSGGDPSADFTFVGNLVALTGSVQGEYVET